MIQLGELPPVVQTIEVKSFATWKLLVAGAITGFSFALGEWLFHRGARRFGAER